MRFQRKPKMLKGRGHTYDVTEVQFQQVGAMACALHCIPIQCNQEDHWTATVGFPLMALNHLSRLCRSVKDSTAFYSNVLGFVPRPWISRTPGSSTMEWGIHLVHCNDEEKLHKDVDELNPMDHILFQYEAVEEKLKERGVKYPRRNVEDDERDLEGFMIEICNCENLKLRPSGSLGKIRLPIDRHNPPVELDGPRVNDDF